MRDFAGPEARAKLVHAGKVSAPLTTVPVNQWRALAARAIEPNGYYLPDWELAVNADAAGRTNASALCAWAETPGTQDRPPRLIGLMPVTSMWHAYRIPLPALVSAHPYGTLCTPLLDRELTRDAAVQLIAQARQAGARALILRDVAPDGAVIQALSAALRDLGTQPLRLHSYFRAVLDASREADAVLREGLGAKKLKELRRQRSRLAELGPVDFQVARTPQDVAEATELFLRLEASGWKGRRGTALIQNEGDASFVRRATVALATLGQCEMVTLSAGSVPVAAAIVLRHQDRAFYFKLGIDERFAKFSPGVQLTLDLTRHLCSDPAIKSADSTASADHPMINPIWRGRFAIADLLLPLRPGDPAVAAIRAALTMRRSARRLARGAADVLRGRGRH